MRIQKTLNWPMANILREVDNIRFEDPMFENRNVKVRIYPTRENTEIKSSKDTYGDVEIILYVKDFDDLANMIPHLFGHALVYNCPVEVAENIKSNMLPKNLDLIAPQYSGTSEAGASPERQLLGTYLANRLFVWLMHSAKQSVGFKEYLKYNPPDTYILGVLNNALLQL